MEHLVGREQLVELRAVCRGAGLVLDVGNRLLHRLDGCADRHFAAELLLQIGRGRQVVGMGMGFQQPAAGQIMFAHKGDHLVGRGGRGAARFRVVVEHGVDHGAGAAVVLVDDVGNGGGGGIEKGLYLRCHRGGAGQGGTVIISPRLAGK